MLRMFSFITIFLAHSHHATAYNGRLAASGETGAGLERGSEMGARGGGGHGRRWQGDTNIRQGNVDDVRHISGGAQPVCH